MAAGKPILVSSKGETNIVIEDAKCGICCPPNDAEALANAAKKIAKSDQLEIYAKNAVEYNETNFEWIENKNDATIFETVNSNASPNFF